MAISTRAAEVDVLREWGGLALILSAALGRNGKSKIVFGENLNTVYRAARHPSCSTGRISQRMSKMRMVVLFYKKSLLRGALPLFQLLLHTAAYDGCNP